jgi:hypothetical protein
MSNEQETPAVPNLAETPHSLGGFETASKPEEKKKSPKWIAASDLPDIISILAKADQISPQEAVNRLNNMVSKGLLVIVPLFGTKRKS